MSHQSLSTWCLSAVAGVCAALGFASGVHAQQFIALPAGYVAHDVSADGTIVVGGTEGNANGFLWRWKQDPAPTVIPGGAAIYGTSDDGSVLIGTVWNATFGKSVAARWTQATG
jgi:uncharacterized membrane protein